MNEYYSLTKHGAAGVFLEKGYERTTIGDISRALGISQGLCYRYFGSKEEIYDGVIDSYAAMIVEEHLKHRPQQQSIDGWIDSIPGALAAMLQAERNHPQMYKLVHNPANGKMHTLLCLKVGETLVPWVTDVLEQAGAKGELQLADCRAAAAFGVYGEIGLILAEGPDCGQAIAHHWRRLPGRNK